MFTRVARWFLITAPALAGVLLLIFGTAGSTSVAFGITMIAIAVMIWMWNWFIRMSFNEDTRERETQAREEYAAEIRRRRELAARAAPEGPAPPRHLPGRRRGRQRRPS